MLMLIRDLIAPEVMVYSGIYCVIPCLLKYILVCTGFNSESTARHQVDTFRAQQYPAQPCRPLSVVGLRRKRCPVTLTWTVWVQFLPAPTHETCLCCSAKSGLMKLACPHNHVVAGELTSFGCVEWQSELFRGVMRAHCYPFDMPKKRFHGFNLKVSKYTFSITVYMCIH